jgi:ABC-2 type transport system ATP-binding protein
VEQVAAFGTALHVTGSDRLSLDAVLAPIMAEAGKVWREVPSSLEDVFIHLMREADAQTAAQVAS